MGITLNEYLEKSMDGIEIENINEEKIDDKLLKSTQKNIDKIHKVLHNIKGDIEKYAKNTDTIADANSPIRMMWTIGKQDMEKLYKEIEMVVNTTKMGRGMDVL